MSGIIVVFLGVFLYKVTLHLSSIEKENITLHDADNNSAHFARISSSDSDIFDERRDKRSRSDPDLALSFQIEDEEIDDEVIANINGTSPLRERSVSGLPLEVDECEEESPGLV